MNTHNGKISQPSAIREQVHGPLQGMDYPQPSYLRCAVLGFICGVALFLCAAYALGPVGA